MPESCCEKTTKKNTSKKITPKKGAENQLQNKNILLYILGKE